MEVPSIQGFPNNSTDCKANVIDMIDLKWLNSSVRAQEILIMDRSRFGKRPKLAIPLARDVKLQETTIWFGTNKKCYQSDVSHEKTFILSLDWASSSC